MSTKIFSGAQAKTAQSFAWGEPSRSIKPQTMSLPAANPDAEAAELKRLTETRVRQAYEQGRREGEESTARLLADRMDAQIAKLAESIAEVADYRTRIRREAELDMVRLSLAVVRKILHRDTQTDPDALLGVFKAALAKVESREVLRVRVCPQHADSLRNAVARLGLPQRLELIADPSLAEGGLVLETDQGNLDASIDSQLAEIERGLADRLKGNG